MKVIALRAASVLSLLLAVGHTRGFAAPGRDPVQNTVRATMAANRFHLMDANRTYWELFLGLGYVITALLLMQTALLWMTADAEKRRPGESHAMVWAFLIANVAVLLVDLRFLFIAPVIASALISLAIAVAALASVLGPRRPAMAS